ncbi:hypothetical protein BASA81_005724 [Batrachochytrium salamandrivorans]|nr:hypothetical protein BASA81_005724 [Batrachochytrium salamandrivorans]
MPTLSKKEMNSRLSALRELDSGALRMAQHHDQQLADYMHCTCQEKGRDPNVMPKQTAADIKDDAYELHKQLVLQLTDIQNHVQELQMELDDINR